MHKRTKILLIVGALVASLAAAPSLFAQDSRVHGMMVRGGMMGGGMMGMMGPMGQMMEHCSQMMKGMMGGSGSGSPNEQWRQPPSAPGEKK